MSLIPTISTDYSRRPDLTFLDMGTTLHDNLQESSVFVALKPKLTGYMLQLTDFRKAVQAVKSGVKGAKFERDRTRLVVEATTRELSADAIAAAPDRPDQWAEVGFPLTKSEATPRTLAAPVTNFTLTDGDGKLSLRATVDRQPGMYAYLARIRPKAGPSGRFCYETLILHTPDILITGLDSETAYCVEMAAWNDTGDLQWSEVLSRIVQ